VVDHALAKIFGDKMLTCDLFAVANVCVYLRQGGYVFIDVSQDNAKTTQPTKFSGVVAHGRENVLAVIQTTLRKIRGFEGYGYVRAPPYSAS